MRSAPDEGTEGGSPETEDEQPASPSPQPPRSLRFDVSLYVLTVAALTLFYMPSRLRIANADALLPSLMSTQHWTLFYWGQDRLANLVPLLALPIRDELQNFYAQSFVFGTAFFAAITLGVIAQAGDRLRRSPVLTAGVIIVSGAIATSVVLTPFASYVLMFEQVYAISIVLYVAGCVGVLDQRRWLQVLGCLATLAAVMVNPSASLLLLVAVAALSFDEQFKARALRLAAVTAAAFVVAWLAMRLFPAGPSNAAAYRTFSPGRFADSWEAARNNIQDSFGKHSTWIVVVSVIVQTACWPRLTPIARRLSIALPVYAALWFVLFSSNEWVGNSLHFRYFFPIHATVLFFVIGAIVQVTQLACSDRVIAAVATRGVAIGACALLAVCVLAGAIRIADGIEVDTLNAARPDAAAAEANGAQLIVGEYWSVWPVVMVARDQGFDAYGVTYRDDPLRDQITSIADAAQSANGELLVSCVNMALDECAAQLSESTDRDWAVTRLVQQSPVVIAVQPAP